ncbi:4-hydroxythreonine-4-phosphate dehydrogenase [Burkholderia sp. WAC0059]|uniref:PdxA family dehydrogenase n=1 Tax=Burkholderia sp. WAC0059 TaxID=2066022 RepID=UPI000C7F0659|nr:4-hydroxythreonine-4-phosphate dehydrogenase PdxA [Burkholderia sp. WAC0059]PLZ03481.1 4-hydroxythreonine-4-phosphate dehydrogenase [Burkholderia sp. WAC0059]
MKPLIGLMPGDATGIGPELVVKLLSTPAARERANVVIVGDARVLELGMKDAGVRIPYRTISRLEEADHAAEAVPLLDLHNIDPALYERGKLNAESGRLTGETLKFMTDRALAGALDGICFAPLNKAALHRGGWNYHDEHQMFAAWTGHVGYFGEVNIIPQFSTFRVTSHVALREAVDMVKPDRIEGTLVLAHETLRAFGKASPRIGVAALNPHGGENGLFGDEEIRIIRPTLEALRAKGLSSEGPFPSDTVFIKARRGDFDAVIIMYHDQGQIATKLLGFSQGVTFTGGLKTVYATPAHGVAYDIVGTGKADVGAMAAAFDVAARTALARKTAREAVTG